MNMANPDAAKVFVVVQHNEAGRIVARLRIAGRDQADRVAARLRKPGFTAEVVDPSGRRRKAAKPAGKTDGQKRP